MKSRLEALQSIHSLRIPLVIRTSRTSAEVELLRGRLPFNPVIIENGGAILIPIGYFSFTIPGVERRGQFDVLKLGDSYASAVQVLQQAAQCSGASVKGFSQLTAEEVSERTGMELSDAELAKKREFDEPFFSLDPARTRSLLNAIEHRGKRWALGSHSYHIFGPSDKSSAVWMLIKFYEREFGTVETVGLGDSPDDISFLELMQRQIIVESPHAEALIAALPQAEVARSGNGWNDALLKLLENQPAAVAPPLRARAAAVSQGSSFAPNYEPAGFQRNQTRSYNGSRLSGGIRG